MQDTQSSQTADAEPTGFDLNVHSVDAATLGSQNYNDSDKDRYFEGM
ncbi:hypothetical protein [Streptomyces lichenis]|uniref:Albusnodin family lasso peptide n=1 Tax=Streptomyces lichenis TaxID=2306967 RepID=A0ABT0I4A3_9ACTN|nr:hypothetical protein [Streptomyces lichenis]MCK8676161.1 hypothetical protein [Streptomyces lichenis]